jgi:hypothetical protein
MKRSSGSAFLYYIDLKKKILTFYGIQASYLKQMMLLPLWGDLPPTLGAVSADLQKAFGEPLMEFINLVRHGERSFRPKVINDPVWRMVRIEHWEVVILDSPIVQRLRYIQQLGLAGLVFPGSNYSRFEHSIGVLHQAQRLIESVNRNTHAFAVQENIYIGTPISPKDEVLLRLSALLHDVGHGFLSHVSERVLSRLTTLEGYGSIKDLRVEARDFFGCHKLPPPAEILASLIVLLPEFVELLELARIPYWSDVKDLALYIAKIISGGRDRTRPFIIDRCIDRFPS